MYNKIFILVKNFREKKKEELYKYMKHPFKFKYTIVILILNHNKNNRLNIFFTLST